MIPPGRVLVHYSIAPRQISMNKFSRFTFHVLYHVIRVLPMLRCQNSILRASPFFLTCPPYLKGLLSTVHRLCLRGN